MKNKKYKIKIEATLTENGFYIALTHGKKILSSRVFEGNKLPNRIYLKKWILSIKEQTNE